MNTDFIFERRKEHELFSLKIFTGAKVSLLRRLYPKWVDRNIYNKMGPDVRKFVNHYGDTEFYFWSSDERLGGISGGLERSPEPEGLVLLKEWVVRYPRPKKRRIP